MDMDLDPVQISAHELMKCHVDVPSKIAWLNAQPIASPSLSFVSCIKVPELTKADDEGLQSSKLHYKVTTP
ncbi:hypothetical protein HanXRQr2_Chr14g0669941 [Helianthus annuus]|uniref:Uncharacterized protein n=1 Tax=Helianthus annuus TaxID=4232 RepID=A0A9K3EDU9_HELAN|nr:hypothetical protein HanXRQr2_Chr14g0669941 [Helianthus annuus]